MEPTTMEENPIECWRQFCSDGELDNMEHSSKLIVLFSILDECKANDEKLLVFSQSLYTLNVIEHFLKMIDKNTENPNPDQIGRFQWQMETWN